MDSRSEVDSKLEEIGQNQVAELKAKIVVLEVQLETVKKLNILKTAANQLARELIVMMLNRRVVNSYDHCEDIQKYIKHINNIENINEHDAIPYATFYILKRYHEPQGKWYELPRTVDTTENRAAIAAEKVIAIEKERNPSRISEYEKRLAADLEKEKQERQELARYEIARREADKMARLAQEAEAKKQAEIKSKEKKKSPWWFHP